MITSVDIYVVFACKPLVSSTVVLRGQVLKLWTKDVLLIANLIVIIVESTCMAREKKGHANGSKRLNIQDIEGRKIIA